MHLIKDGRNKRFFSRNKKRIEVCPILPAQWVAVFVKRSVNVDKKPNFSKYVRKRTYTFVPISNANASSQDVAYHALLKTLLYYQKRL
jgi:hypothetical protein